MPRLSSAQLAAQKKRQAEGAARQATRASQAGLQGTGGRPSAKPRGQATLPKTSRPARPPGDFVPRQPTSSLATALDTNKPLPRFAKGGIIKKVASKGRAKKR